MGWNFCSLIVYNLAYFMLWSFYSVSLQIIICFWIFILQNDSLMHGIAHFVLVLLSIGYYQYQYNTGP